MKQLETERLILKKWTFDDVDDLYDYGKSHLVGPSAGWKPHKSKDESKKIIKMFIDADDTLAITLKNTGKVIGGIGLHKTNPVESIAHLNQREIGYVLHPDYWGNGYVPEAVERLKKYAFNELDLDLLWCGHYDFNMKSKRVVEKCGFIYQFTREKVLEKLDNKRVHMLYYWIEHPERNYMTGQ